MLTPASQRVRRPVRAPYSAIALIVLMVLCASSDTRAHKPITSRFNYAHDVFPLIREHCASCHVPNGPAPMSLMSYDDAVKWAESIRYELTSGRMPPWPVDPESPQVSGAHVMSTKDLDVIVTWASGGTPPGDLRTLQSQAFSPRWALGVPDWTIAMPAPHTLAKGIVDERADFSLSTGLSETKWIKAVDLMPGDCSIVRDAVISVENGPVLALWQPGEKAVSVPDGAAFSLPAASQLHLHIHYKKHFDREQDIETDTSSIGLYFADPPAAGRSIRSLTIDSTAATGNETRTLSAVLPTNARIVALRPMVDMAYASVNVDAFTSDGQHVPLLMLRGPRAEWVRRYWLEHPVDLSTGSRVDATFTPFRVDADEPTPSRRLPLQLALDYVVP
jgi:hypothetical protein